jgi:hypothetical protein
VWRGIYGVPMARFVCVRESSSRREIKLMWREAICSRPLMIPRET